MSSTATYIGSHWVKLFFMNTLGKLAFSSSTTLLSICEQKDTSSKERSLQDSSNFLKDAGLTILVPVRKQNRIVKLPRIVKSFKLLMQCHEKMLLQHNFYLNYLVFKLKASQRVHRTFTFKKPSVFS